MYIKFLFRHEQLYTNTCVFLFIEIASICDASPLLKFITHYSVSTERNDLTDSSNRLIHAGDTHDRGRTNKTFFSSKTVNIIFLCLSSLRQIVHDISQIETIIPSVS